MAEATTFSKGERVPQEGDYVCVPCGYRRHFQPGEQFSECLSCLSGTADGHEDYVEGMEMWEPLKDGPAEPAPSSSDARAE
ncbi:MAG: hypothetical protein HY340_01845 [Candidatus Kerfeldbacteria bacterium]|nr:hypothetical protein [Candidatus Kerfeldbacteria bacterium]